MTTIHHIPFVDVTAAIPLDGYKLAIEFEDGKAGVFDMTPFLDYPAWESLRNPELFKRVSVQYGTATWPGNIDMAPERLYTDMAETRAAYGSAA